MAAHKLEKPIIAYKGFGYDMTCKGFKYKKGQEYDMGDEQIKLGKSGFHACLNPIDCLSFYDEYHLDKFYKVELSGFIDQDRLSDVSKVCASHIKILEKLSVEDLFNIKYPDLHLQRKNIGVVTCKADIEKLLKRNIKIGNEITLIDGKYNNWVCVHINKDDNDKNSSYIFMMHSPIFSTMDTRRRAKYFKDTLFNRKILLPLGKSIETILENHLIPMEIDDGKRNNYTTLITLPSKQDISTRYPKFDYFGEYYNKYRNATNNDHLELKNTWLRPTDKSVFRSGYNVPFFEDCNFSSSSWYQASNAMNCYSIIKIG